MAGRDAAPPGVGRSCTPGRAPEQTPRLLPGPPRAGHPENRKRKEVAWGTHWRGDFFFSRPRAAPLPSFEGTEKRRALPRPTQVRDRHSVGFFPVGPAKPTWRRDDTPDPIDGSRRTGRRPNGYVNRRMQTTRGRKREITLCSGPCFMVLIRHNGKEWFTVKTVEAAVIGVGWVGGTRAETLARTALCDKLHLCEIRPDRLAQAKALYKPATATRDYQDIIRNENISVVYISTTPESNHYPIARDCLRAGKNVMLEKPIALELWEADELIMLAKRNNVKFTIGYSQRFNTKIAYAKKKITDGTLGNVVSVMVSRHLSRSLGKKIASRVRLSPVVMESTHDLDFVFWLLEPAKPVRVYSQGAYGYMQPINGSHDVMFTIVTMDNGVVVMIGGGWNLPPSYPNYFATWVEITRTDGALVLDATQRDNWLNTERRGQEFPMSSMPGEMVDHVFAGGMGPETIHFLEACIRNSAVMVTPESARTVMETYTAADLSADRNEPVD